MDFNPGSPHILVCNTLHIHVYLQVKCFFSINGDKNGDNIWLTELYELSEIITVLHSTWLIVTTQYKGEK